MRLTRFDDLPKDPEVIEHEGEVYVVSKLKEYKEIEKHDREHIRGSQ
jgi:hypothetical protein